MAEKKQIPLRLSEKLYQSIAQWAEDSLDEELELHID